MYTRSDKRHLSFRAQGSYRHLVNITLCYRWALNWHTAITWTRDGKVSLHFCYGIHYIRASHHMPFRKCGCCLTHWTLWDMVAFSKVWLSNASYRLNPWALLVTGWGLRTFLRWWPHSTMCASPLILFMDNLGYLNNPIFSNLGLCTAWWACFMCLHELWPKSVSHRFSSLNSSLGLTGGKCYQKITIPIFRLILQNFAFHMLLFHMFFTYSFLLLSFILTLFRLVCYCCMWLYFSQGLVKS